MNRSLTDREAIEDGLVDVLAEQEVRDALAWIEEQAEAASISVGDVADGDLYIVRSAVRYERHSIVRRTTSKERAVEAFNSALRVSGEDDISLVVLVKDENGDLEEQKDVVIVRRALALLIGRVGGTD